jgi:hypothetical protein
LDNSDFVCSEIDSLLSKGCISEVIDKPLVVNPLTVSCNKNKKRLVLDARHINPHMCKFKCKYEGSSVGRQMFKVGDFLFTYDLKSAYHHIEINQVHRTYLGFSFEIRGKVKYFVFNVLPFGISTAGYIFTKVTRVMIKFWRGQGKKIVMFLDDGLGGDDTYEKSKLASQCIQSDLKSFGFLIAQEKCDWEPRVQVTWLGEVWNTELNLIKVTDTRVSKLLATLDWFIQKVASGQLFVKARDVASIVGQIISMQGAIGGTVRLRTRGLYTCILSRASWDSPVLIDDDAWKEAVFWKENVCSLNGSVLEKKEACDMVVYSDASASGYGGYIVQREDSEVLGTWSQCEVDKSSTWRELEAIYRVLNSEKDYLKDHNVKWYTDNKNVIYIIETGSKKGDLQSIAVRLYEVCTQYNIDVCPV